MSRVVYIYALCEPGQPHNVRYIGKTVQSLRRRLDGHLRASRLLQFNTHRDRWIRVLRNKGKIPTIKLLDIGTEDTWEEIERSTILAYRAAGFALTNHTDGGEGCGGWKHSPESRAKIGENNRSRVVGPERGRKIALARTGSKASEETRLKLSISHKGRAAWNKGIPNSEETRRKVSAANKGRKHTPEACTNMSLAQLGNQKWLGKKHSKETLAKMSKSRKEWWMRRESGASRN